MKELKTKKIKKQKSSKLIASNHPLSSHNLFTNREIGWLNFNRRVLAEAEDSRNPLLERLRFLSISNSNLDEFFMKRVGGLKRHLAYGVSSRSADGKTPLQQLKEIRKHVEQMIQEQAHCYRMQLLPELQKNGIELVSYKDLSAAQREKVDAYFQLNVFPVLTPLSVDPGHPFPFISNLSVSLGVTLLHSENGEHFFARVKVPKVLPSWIPVGKGNVYVNLIDLMIANLQSLFPGMKILNVMPFRLTRNADSAQDQEDAEDLLEAIAEELKQRKFAEVVRLEHGPHPDKKILEFLKDELELKDGDIYENPGLLDYGDLNTIADLDFSHLKFSPYIPQVPHSLQEEGVGFFTALKYQDFLIHNPFESFAGTVEKMIRIASEDPKVLAIKMTLYRTGDHSPFIKSLIRAAEQGKQVVCLIELQARFDEARNIYWANELEDAGVHVVYGIVGLKTHAKLALVVRQEDEGLKSYAHIGTGNYNVSTSRFYTDLGLLTTHKEITEDVVEFFHYLTGISLKKEYKHLLVAPVNMLSRFKEMIVREGHHAEKGRPAEIIVKFNNFEENDIALALYEASSRGVKIEMIVRGFCCLKPGVHHMSENISVKSVIGRYLEHSRIYYFRNGEKDPLDGEFYIGSADWMYRNLHNRVEAIVPLLDRQLKEKCWEILQAYSNEMRQAWKMDEHGHYQKLKSEEVGIHQKLMLKARNPGEGGE